jgi:alkylation response protein AidB-like acyl-CoA dehydrogenase
VLGGSDAQKADWLPRIADGSVVATLAVDEGARHEPRKVAATVSGGKLNGRKTFVLEGMAADLFIVSARVSGLTDAQEGIELFIVSSDAAGVKRERLSLADNRGAANVTFENVAVRDTARLSGGYDLLEKVLDRARAGFAAEMLGAATQAFEVTVDYLKTRVQFGQPIGSFQALQHRAAVMLTNLELARSTVEAALSGIDADKPNVPELVSIAKAKMGDVLHVISNEMVQLHGGIGMTDAHDAGFYLKRARSCEAVFGNQAYHRDRYARLNGY